MGLLLLLGVLMAVGVVWITIRRRMRERAGWVRLRLRVQPDTAVAPLDAAIHACLRHAGGGEIISVRDGSGWAVVVAVPAPAEVTVRQVMATYAPHGHVARVARVHLPPTPRWALLAPASGWTGDAAAALVISAVTAQGTVGRVALSPTHGGWPMLRRWWHGWGEVCRSVAAWRAVPLRGTLLPSDASTAGWMIPPLPTLDTSVPLAPGGALPLGTAMNGMPVALPLGRQQRLAVVGGIISCRTALRPLLDQGVALGVGTVGWVSAELADAWLPTLSPATRERVRVVDGRTVATTVTLDLGAMLDDAALADLLARLAALGDREPPLRLLRPALAAWRTTDPARQWGTLLALLGDPPSALCAAALYDGSDRRFVASRWRRRLAALTRPAMMGVLATPGDDVPGILLAGGMVLVIQPTDPLERTLLGQIVGAVVAALPASARPCMVVSETGDGATALRDHAHAAVWTSAQADTVPAWALVVGGALGRGVPFDRWAIHPVTAATLRDRWLLLHPLSTAATLVVPPGVVVPIAAAADFVSANAWLPAVQRLLAADALRNNPTSIDHLKIDHATAAATRLQMVVRTTAAPPLVTDSAIQFGASAGSGAGLAVIPSHIVMVATDATDPARDWQALLALVADDGSPIVVPWTTVDHLAICGDREQRVLVHALLGLVESIHADHHALFWLGALTALQPLMTIPHAEPVVDGSLTHQVDHVLTMMMTPALRVRHSWVVLVIPTLTAVEIALVHRLLVRAATQPLTLILHCESRTDLALVQAYLSVVTVTNAVVLERPAVGARAAAIPLHAALPPLISTPRVVERCGALLQRTARPPLRAVPSAHFWDAAWLPTDEPAVGVVPSVPLLVNPDAVAAMITPHVPSGTFEAADAPNSVHPRESAPERHDHVTHPTAAVRSTAGPDHGGSNEPAPLFTLDDCAAAATYLVARPQRRIGAIMLQADIFPRHGLSRNKAQIMLRLFVQHGILYEESASYRLNPLYLDEPSLVVALHATLTTYVQSPTHHVYAGVGV